MSMNVDKKKDERDDISEELTVMLSNLFGKTKDSKTSAGMLEPPTGAKRERNKLRKVPLEELSLLQILGWMTIFIKHHELI